MPTRYGHRSLVGLTGLIGFVVHVRILSPRRDLRYTNRARSGHPRPITSICRSTSYSGAAQLSYRRREAAIVATPWYGSLERMARRWRSHTRSSCTQRTTCLYTRLSAPHLLTSAGSRRCLWLPATGKFSGTRLYTRQSLPCKHV